MQDVIRIYNQSPELNEYKKAFILCNNRAFGLDETQFYNQRVKEGLVYFVINKQIYWSKSIPNIEAIEKSM